MLNKFFSKNIKINKRQMCHTHNSKKETPLPFHEMSIENKIKFLDYKLINMDIKFNDNIEKINQRFTNIHEKKSNVESILKETNKKINILSTTILFTNISFIGFILSNL